MKDRTHKIKIDKDIEMRLQKDEIEILSIDVGEETDQSERFISMPVMIEDTLMRCCPLKAHK